MLHADVSTSHRFTGVQLIPTLLSQAHHRLLHKKVSCTPLPVNLVTVKLIRLVCRSLIASYIGNIIGGLLVGLPAVYFYLGDWKAGGLVDAEEARAEKSSHTLSLDK
jgi:formate/nitrite transporter FocA (FNT family)